MCRKFRRARLLEPRAFPPQKRDFPILRAAGRGAECAAIFAVHNNYSYNVIVFI
jgi:hypothetical protein